MPTRRRYTFYGNGIITRNVALFPDSNADIAYATKTNEVTAESFEVEQAIDPNHSGDLEAGDIRGRIRLNNALSELRYGNNGLPNRFARVQADRVRLQHTNTILDVLADGVDVTGDATFNDNVNIGGTLIVDGDNIARSWNGYETIESRTFNAVSSPQTETISFTVPAGRVGFLRALTAWYMIPQVGFQVHSILYHDGVVAYNSGPQNWVAAGYSLSFPWESNYLAPGTHTITIQCWANGPGNSYFGSAGSYIRAILFY